MILGLILPGIIFIGIGFLVQAAPDTIAGYNTMSAEKRKNVDIKGLARFLRNGLILTGASSIVASLLLYALKLYAASEAVSLATIIAGVTITVVKARKYDRNTRRNKAAGYIAAGIAAAAASALLLYGILPAKIKTDKGFMQVTGMYGFSIPVEEIVNAELSDSLPRILIRTNGLALGDTLKGWFKVEGCNRCRLFIRASDKGPYLIVTSSQEPPVILSTPDRVTAEKLLAALKGTDG